MRDKIPTSQRKWYVLYILGTILGIGLGKWLTKSGEIKLFGAYLALFLAYHAIFPFLASREAKTRSQHVIAVLLKFIFPLISICGWIFLWLIFFR
jgi:hypothetical protein